MLYCPVSSWLYDFWEMKLTIVYFVCSLIACLPYWNVKKAALPAFDIYTLSILSSLFNQL